MISFTTFPPNLDYANRLFEPSGPADVLSFYL